MQMRTVIPNTLNTNTYQGLRASRWA